MVGYLQCIDRPIDDPNKNIDFLQVNSLLYQQNSISYSLLAFLQCDDIPQVINRILGDILKQFRGDRTYIVEIDRKKQVQNCTYESTAKGVSEERIISKIYFGMILSGGIVRSQIENLLS